LYAGHGPASSSTDGSNTRFKSKNKKRGRGGGASGSGGPSSGGPSSTNASGSGGGGQASQPRPTTPWAAGYNPWTGYNPRTGTVTLRCDCPGDLYPLRLPQHHAFTASSSASVELWHQRLGHPGTSSLSQVLRSFDFQCNKSVPHSCHSCKIGKHVRLPFTPHISLFNLFTVMFGPHQFIATQGLNIMSCFLMIIRIIFGPFPCPKSLRSSLSFTHSSLMSARNLGSLFLRCRHTMAKNLTLMPCAISYPNTAPFFVSPAPIRPSKMERPSAYYVRLTIVCELCYFTVQLQLLSGPIRCTLRRSS
jgi:hypothetical protein